MIDRSIVAVRARFRRADSGPAWLRALLVAMLASLILGVGLLAHATKAALEASDFDDVDQVKTVRDIGYGVKDPYGYGPRANADAETPGGAPNQADLSGTNSSEQPDAAAARADKN